VRILFVEDDTDLRDSLGAALRHLGYEVDTAGGGEEAWALYNEQDYPVVVTDWLMADGDGLELCRRIRGAEREHYTYLIVLSGLGGTESYLEGMHAGADDFVVKPCEPRELDARLRVARRILGLQSRIHQLEGLLPICSYCKRIRGENDVWFSVEQYLSGRSNAHFTHGVCPVCYVTHVETDLEALRRSGM
jgi:DNA-binding response OmpR family regulator